MKKLKKHKSLLAFLLSLLLGCIIIIPQIIINKGIFLVVADFNEQQIPFNMIINYSLKHGSYLWTWFNDLGSNFIGTYSFYNLTSPFNIIGYLFPGKLFPYLVGPIYILKYAVCGLTSFLYLKRYVKNKNYAIIGSLLYTFSGFQLTNTMFYHFHDVVALFPLLLYTFDNLIYDNKKWHFTLMVSLLLFTNWFFFIGEAIFIIIYYLIKILTKEIKFNIKKFTQIAIESIIGIGITSVILIPSLLFTMSNPRIDSTWDLKYSLIYKSFGTTVEIIRAFLFPPETMTYRSFLTIANHTSIESFLPVIGITLIIPFILKNKKDWKTILLITLFIMMNIPFLNSMFYVFTTVYYARWIFMPILIMSLISITTLEKKYKITSGTIGTIIGYILFAISILLFIRITGIKEILFNKNFIITTLVTTIILLIITNIVIKLKNEKKKINTLIITIFIYTGFWANYMLYTNNIYSVENDKFKNYYSSINELEKYKNNRMNSIDLPHNIGNITKTNIIHSFNSNINGEAFNFYKSIDIKRETETLIDVNNKELHNLLGIRYIISSSKNNNLQELGYKYIDKTKTYYIYENIDYKQFGFNTTSYISKEDFNNNSKKISTLLDTVVLDKNQIKKYKDLYNHKTKYISNDFKYTNNGFISKINSNNETLAIYQVPYDKGWKATNNKKKIKIENVDNGFMAIKIHKGKNNIEFKYTPNGLKIGMIISGVSLLSYLIIRKKEA